MKKKAKKIAKKPVREIAKRKAARVPSRVPLRTTAPGPPVRKHHDDIELVAGDDWTIPFALLDANGNAIDLTGATMIWYLIGPDGLWIADLDQSSVNVSNPATGGAGTIKLPRQYTSLESGRYHDQMRVILANNETSVWTGLILVDADPAQCAA